MVSALTGIPNVAHMSQRDKTEADVGEGVGDEVGANVGAEVGSAGIKKRRCRAIGFSEAASVKKAEDAEPHLSSKTARQDFSKVVALPDAID